MLLKHRQQLIAQGVVTEEQMNEALANPEAKKFGLLYALLMVDGVDGDKVMRLLAGMYKAPFLDISHFQPSEELLAKCPESLCNDYGFVPVDEKNGELIIATGNPMDFQALDALQFKLGERVRAIFARPDVIRKKIRDFYQGDAAFEDAMSGLEGDELATEDDEEKEETDIDAVKKGAQESPIIKLVNGIFVQAMKMGSSDIHIEAGERVSLVRMRVDGRLRKAIQYPTKIHPVVISRIKIMSKLDISNTRTPQDGRLKIKLWGKSFDVRVSTLPSLFGEKCVMRILDKSGLSLDLDLLGFEKRADQRIRECIARPNGAVLVTGPTGSGKTTTLYSFLNHINDSETNIVTVEDPVEFQLKGINQVQVNVKAGMTFSAALRSILRQDPDVVMLGEIRDEETAEIAMHAAQTGHLVLSTLHTNDAPSTVSRLVEMGIDAAVAASSINIVVAQRLARRLCKHCKRKEPVPEGIAERFGFPEGFELYVPVGCKECMNIGYKGRIGVHEVLYVSGRISEMIARRATDRDLGIAAREEHMYSLFEDGLNKALMGITSMDEVLRNSLPLEDFNLAERLKEDGTLMSLGDFQAATTAAMSSKKTTSDKKTILVIDDSKSIRNLVRFVLQSEGYEVIEAEDGQQGWDTVQRMGNQIDLVLTDYEMPNMTGPELVTAIREKKKYDGLAVVMLTSRRDEDDEVLGLESGADDYIFKPLEPMKLQARVRKILKMYDRILNA